MRPTTKPNISNPSQETNWECDRKCLECIEHILRKWKMDFVLPVRLIHSNQVSSLGLDMRYEPPNTFIIDDTSEYVQYIFDNTKSLQARHGMLATMLAFTLVEMKLIVERKPYSGEAYEKVFEARVEIQRFLQNKKGYN